MNNIFSYYKEIIINKFAIREILAKKPNKPLMPGKSTKIIAEVNTADLHTKRIHKVVTVMTNTSPNITPLEIKGRIK